MTSCSSPSSRIARWLAGTRAAALLLALFSLGCADAPDAPSDAVDARRRGEEIADRMLQAYRKAKSYADHGTYVRQAAYRGEGIERELPFYEMSIAYERPNRVRLRMKEALAGSTGQKEYDIASNGTTMRCTSAELDGQVQESAAPLELTTENLFPDPLLREVFVARSLGDVFPQLAMLLNQDDDSLVFPHDEAPELLDAQDLNGQKCYRVASGSPEGQRILWIDCDDYALRRMELPIDKEREALDAAGEFSHLKIWIDFKEPQFDVEISAEAFELPAPEDARRVRHFVAPPPAAPPSELGEPLPDFEFETVDGQKVTPASIAGKVVLLDFWQIDCPPCKRHTPRLEEIYRDQKDADDFAFYAVNTEAPVVPDEAVERTLHNWGGTMPLLRDRTRSSFDRLKLIGTPTLMLLGKDGRLQMKHMGELQDPAALTEAIGKLRDGVDLIAQGREEHAKLVADFNRELEAETIKESLLDVEITQPVVAPRKEPATIALSQRWEVNGKSLAQPGNILVTGDGDSDRILVLDGGGAVVELGLDGKEQGRHELEGNAERAGGFIRAASEGDAGRVVVVSGVGWQKVRLFDAQWNPSLVFPREQHPGIADVQLADLTGDGDVRLYVGYWGGVGVQGVGLDGKRKWADRSLDQVVELIVAPGEGEDGVAKNLWCTSNRGTLVELDARGQRRRQITVEGHEIMHAAVADLAGDGGASRCGLAVEKVGQYRAVGFSTDGKVAWQRALPAGEYVHQVERIQAVTLPGDRRAWMIAAPGGAILWLGADGTLLDEFHYGEELCGLALAKADGMSILLVSTPKALTAWTLGDAASDSTTK